MQIHSWTATILETLRNQANPELAAPMAKYMKNKFIYLGIPSPLRKSLIQIHLHPNQRPPKEFLFPIVQELWIQPEREFQYVALSLLEKYQSQLSPEDIPHILHLIPQKSWWDTVDALAGSVLSQIIKKHPDCLYPNCQHLIQSSNFWENRTAIIAQLKCGNKTNTQFLTEAILPHMHSTEFFVRKAIGWSLRQYARSNTPWVIQFVSNYEHQLAGLSKREALKHIASF